MLKNPQWATYSISQRQTPVPFGLAPVPGTLAMSGHSGSAGRKLHPMTQAPVNQPATDEESDLEQPRRSRRWLLWTVKIAVTFGVLAWLFHDIGLASLKSHWYKITLGTLGMALALQLIAYAIGLYRWWLLLRRANVRVPYLSVKPAYYLGLFFNQLLPTGVGGDAIRTYRLYKRGLEARGLVGSALMDRLIGTFSIVGLSIAGLILSGAFSLSGRDL